MISAVLNFLKPPGMTSHDAVSFVRHTYRQKRVGHSGTLDPAAAGVLPIYLGNATRLVEYGDSFDKTYRAEVLLGIKTDTGDDTGTVLHQTTVKLPPLQRIREVIESFQGGYEQVPPMYSALKIDGKKLYELARAGKIVQRQARRIEIPSISLLAVHDCRLTIEVNCSKGTYIRTLCEDIGERLSMPATMSLLLRTRVGPFAVNQSASLEEITAEPEQVLLPPEYAVSHLPACSLSESESIDLRHGRQVRPVCLLKDGDDEQLVRLYDAKRTFFGVGRFDSAERMLKPIKIFSGGMDELC
jgi:tRNA pseudouridine55 synthase